jgi:hypothetical protein
VGVEAIALCWDDLDDFQIAGIARGGDALLDAGAGRFGGEQGKGGEESCEGDALGFVAAAWANTGHGDGPRYSSEEAGCDQVGATIGVNGEAALTSTEAFEGFVDANFDLCCCEIAEQPKAATVGVASQGDAGVFASQHMDAGVLQAVVATDAGKG